MNVYIIIFSMDDEILMGLDIKDKKKIKDKPFLTDRQRKYVNLCILENEKLSKELEGLRNKIDEKCLISSVNNEYPNKRTRDDMTGSESESKSESTPKIKKPKSLFDNIASLFVNNNNENLNEEQNEEQMGTLDESQVHDVEQKFNEHLRSDPLYMYEYINNAMQKFTNLLQLGFEKLEHERYKQINFTKYYNELNHPHNMFVQNITAYYNNSKKNEKTSDFNKKKEKVQNIITRFFQYKHHRHLLLKFGIFQYLSDSNIIMIIDDAPKNVLEKDLQLTFPQKIHAIYNCRNQISEEKIKNILKVYENAPLPYLKDKLLQNRFLDILFNNIHDDTLVAKLAFKNENISNERIYQYYIKSKPTKDETINNLLCTHILSICTTLKDNVDSSFLSTLLHCMCVYKIKINTVIGIKFINLLEKTENENIIKYIVRILCTSNVIIPEQLKEKMSTFKLDPLLTVLICSQEKDSDPIITIFTDKNNEYDNEIIMKCFAFFDTQCKNVQKVLEYLDYDLPIHYYRFICRVSCTNNMNQDSKSFLNECINSFENVFLYRKNIENMKSYCNQHAEFKNNLIREIQNNILIDKVRQQEIIKNINDI